MTAAQEILLGLRCPYCDERSQLVDSAAVYGRSYGLIYLCKPCHAYVGVHKGTEQALGTLANEDLRKWRKAAHATFDALWQTAKRRQQNRTKAYAWLARQLDIPPMQTHIGMFDEDLCRRTVELCQPYAQQKQQGQHAHNPIHQQPINA